MVIRSLRKEIYERAHYVEPQGDSIEMVLIRMDVIQRVEQDETSKGGEAKDANDSAPEVGFVDRAIDPKMATIAPISDHFF
jgi:hypothetical protein